VTARQFASACALLAGCSFAFVREHSGRASDPDAPLTCTTSRAMPTTDLVIGAVMASAVAAVTYAAVERFNDMCVGECYHAWKPTTLAAFLVVSPWWISSAVGFSDTERCREAYRARGLRAADSAHTAAP
jgi:hypothetical protein